MSILKNLVKNLGLTNITQPKKKYATVGEKKSDEEKERAKYEVKNIDNLKEDDYTKCPSCGVLFHKSEIRANMCKRKNRTFNR